MRSLFIKFMAIACGLFASPRLQAATTMQLPEQPLAQGKGKMHHAVLSDNFRVRIYATDPKITSIQVKIGSVGFSINRINSEPFLSRDQLLNHKINIVCNPSGVTNEIEWMPNTASPPEIEVKRFADTLRTHGLAIDRDIDPGMSLCLKRNSIIELVANHQYVPNLYLKPEQKATIYKCLIDQNGVITLPIFFDDINSNLTPTQDETAAPATVGTKKDPKVTAEVKVISRLDSNDVNVVKFGPISKTGSATTNKESKKMVGSSENSTYWFDAITNSYKLKLIGDVECGAGCMSYDEAERKITAFYARRLGGGQSVINVVFRIVPPESFSTITVYNKKKAFTLPYANIPIDRFFKEELTRRIVGLKCNRTKVEHFRACTLTRNQGMKEITLKKNRTYPPDQDILSPGDIIYIK